MHSAGNQRANIACKSESHQSEPKILRLVERKLVVNWSREIRKEGKTRPGVDRVKALGMVVCHHLKRIMNF